MVPLRPIVSNIGGPTYKLAKHLTSLLAPLVGRNEHHIQNSLDCIQKLRDIQLKDAEILVSFDVESLFTKVPLTETIDLHCPHFNNKEIDLFIHYLTSSYFLWNNTFYEQTDGVAMGSPLSPMVANFFMEHFETQALTSAIDKPTFGSGKWTTLWLFGPTEKRN